MGGKRVGLRELSRRAVREEIAEAATALFLERGFEATTVDDIGAAVGMSQRSVFRYFATKEEIVLGHFGLVLDDMLAALRARPADEPVWTSLRRVFDVLPARPEAPGHQHWTAPVHRMVFETPVLLAGYLQKLHRTQEAVVTELTERAASTGAPYAPGDPAPRALTAAAFGCLLAAQHSWLASDGKGSFTDALDRAMATVGPRA
ncbi:TetR family transcriptional regulator [Streptomyces lavenduligriseus]|uniref:TetR/AcrR family transcriptional regulator n=1 Tax=Streptomyces lavenduligriseus TaxID=67315 RepID=A0ABT0NT00_9ACTN|nr:TetR family transcriptional regulator [Streptomyces lavenduligriseus]MCL3994593.1 TetR/AcrR family transcriptional regulator [Streptomyces lavenduligriseus]